MNWDVAVGLFAGVGFSFLWCVFGPRRSQRERQRYASALINRLVDRNTRLKAERADLQREVARLTVDLGLRDRQIEAYPWCPRCLELVPCQCAGQKLRDGVQTSEPKELPTWRCLSCRMLVPCCCPAEARREEKGLYRIGRRLRGVSEGPPNEEVNKAGEVREKYRPTSAEIEAAERFLSMRRGVV